MKIVLFYFSMIALSTCCCNPSAYQELKRLQKGESIEMILHGQYNVNTVNGDDISSFKLYITFDDGDKKVFGFLGCNRFFGSYILDKNVLKFKALGATKMLCSDDKNEIETKLFKALNKTDGVLFSKNGFTLFDNKKPLLSATKVQLKTNISFEYSATSMQSYKRIIVDEDSISFSKKRKGKPYKISCKETYWNNLIKLCNSLDIESISELEAPSKSFQFDGAPLARLKIMLNGNTYESPSFDHGNPPKEIEALVKEILSSTENIE